MLTDKDLLVLRLICAGHNLRQICIQHNLCRKVGTEASKRLSAALLIRRNSQGWEATEKGRQAVGLIYERG